MIERTEGRGRRIARWLLMVVYAIAGIGHLAATEAMVAIVPSWVPAPHLVVSATGLCELVGVVALLTPRWRRRRAGRSPLMRCAFIPANIQHAMIDLGQGTGLGLSYHLPRLLFQPVFVWWALWATAIIDWPFSRRGRSSVRGS